MTSATSSGHGLRRVAILATALLATLPLGLVPDRYAAASTETLPLGDPDLAETRTIENLASGVTLTHITRGSEPAPPDQINTTTRGPWAVNVITIDRSTATGHLKATYGPDLAQVEKTTDLVRLSDALAGVNASFFTFTASQQYPGDPVGLGLYSGNLLSEPTADPNEVAFVVDSVSNRVSMGHLRWSGSMQNRQTAASLRLKFLNHPPVVPAECVDQPQCTAPGDVVEFTPEFSANTPSGPGAEVVLDRHGCVVRTANTRGTPLLADQTSLQATGRDTTSLLDVTTGGCLSRTMALTDDAGEELPLRPGLFGVNGRYRLTANGQIVVPDGSGSFFDRNPRTIAGTTRDGKIMLATIDGRQTTSVGTTMKETAAVANALGMRDAVNLDGGGSTTMSVNGELANRPSGPTGERAVGDALVYVDSRRPTTN